MAMRRAMDRDVATIRQLVGSSGLPLDGLDHLLPARAVVWEDDATIIGAAVLERHDVHGLLRSVVVRADHRGRGIGEALTRAALMMARAEALVDVHLLTTDAEGYWTRQGFVEVARASAPPPLLASAEFTGACPSTATLMRRDLRPRVDG